MITRNKTSIICTCYCLLIICNTVLSQPVNKTKNTIASKPVSIIILGSKKSGNKSLQDFRGFYSGLNLSYFKKMTEAERAILGFIATYAGTDCDLEYDAKPVRYSCKLPLALGIGYQCSDEYLAFERKWFRNDTAVLNELKECNIRPSGANYVTSFGKIILTKTPGKIKIYFTKDSFSMHRMASADWAETFYFTVDADQVHLVKRTHTEAKVEKLDVPDSI